MLKPIVVACPTCAAPVELLVTDQFTIINGPYVSGMLIQHPDHTTCLNCGTICAPAITGVANLAIIATKVPPREEVKRILTIG